MEPESKIPKIEADIETFFNAIHRTDLEQIKKTLDSLSPVQQKQLVNSVDKFDRSPLHVALAGLTYTPTGKKRDNRIYLSVITELLNRGADINAVDKNNQSLLAHAISNKDWQAAKILLESEADPDVKARTMFIAMQPSIWGGRIGHNAYREELPIDILDNEIQKQQHRLSHGGKTGLGIKDPAERKKAQAQIGIMTEVKNLLQKKSALKLEIQRKAIEAQRIKEKVEKTEEYSDIEFLKSIGRK